MTRLKWVPVFVALAAPMFFFTGCSPKAETRKVLAPGQTEEAFLAEVRQKAGAAPAGGAAAPGPVNGAATGAQPKLELETTAFEMGVIPSTGIAEKKMKVFNRGQAPLKIDKVTTSCGCTTGTMDETLIAPGGTANLVIHVDPKRIPGFYANKVLTVYSNDLANPHPTISVVTHVQPEVEFDPEVLDFGSIDFGKPAKVTTRLRQLQDAPFELMSTIFQKDPPYLKVTQALAPETEWRTKGKKEYVITVEVLPTAPAGPYDEWIILATNLSRTQQLPLKFKGAVVGPYDLAPRTVAVRGVVPGTPMKDVLTLTGKQDLHVTEVTGSNPAIQVTHRPGDKPNTELFGFTVPQRTPSPSVRDTWKIVFEVAGERHEESVPVVVILAREN